MSEEKLSKHDLEKNNATHDFDMSGAQLLQRTMTHDFDGYPLQPDIQYRCRFYKDLDQWLIEPKNGRDFRPTKLPKILSVKKKS